MANVSGVSSVSSVAVIQFLCGVALHEKEKLRSSALKKIIALTPSYCNEKETLINAVKRSAIVFCDVLIPHFSCQYSAQ